MYTRMHTRLCSLLTCIDKLNRHLGQIAQVLQAAGAAVLEEALAAGEDLEEEVEEPVKMVS
jgi:predicted transcriptional regulator